jgi:hypothetical protein
MRIVEEREECERYWGEVRDMPRDFGVEVGETRLRVQDS